MSNSAFGERILTHRNDGGEGINERVEELVTEKGVTMIQIALA